MNEDDLTRFRKPPRPAFAAALYKRISQPMNTKHSPLSFRLLALSAVVVLFVATTLVTPWGWAFAQDVLHFFTRAESDTFPIPASQIQPPPATLTPAPTFALQLKSVEPTAGKTAQPIEGDEPPAPAPTRDPYFPLTVNEVEAQAGFDVPEPTFLPPGFAFRGAAYDSERRVVTLVYKYDRPLGRDRVGIYVTQQRFSDYDPTVCCEIGPSAQVESVQIGQVMGEYVEGAWRGPQTNATPEMVWDPTPFFRTVGWQDAGMRFTVQGIGPAPDKELPGNVGKETLVQIAVSLTSSPALVSSTPTPELRADSLTSVKDAETLAGFNLKEPSVLPEGFDFRYAQYDAARQSVRMVYDDGNPNGIAAIVIFQTPITAAKAIDMAQVYPTGVVETVSIGGATGQYAYGSFFVPSIESGALTPTPGWQPDNPQRTLVWRVDGLQIELYFFASRGYNGRLEKADMIAIAESMR